MKNPHSKMIKPCSENDDKMTHQSKKDIINSSTLSLHIAAYEKSIQDNAAAAVVEDTNEGSKKSTFCTFSSSLSAIKNPFEFPRQQKSEATKPETIQFKASQRLLNPIDSIASASSLNTMLKEESTSRQNASGDDEEKIHPQKFYQYFNPNSGQMEWKVSDAEAIEDDEDMIIQIARSNFGDMIYDYDRNDRYSAGLKYHIEKLKAQGKSIHVADIGTGTGLLSLMAVRHGADKVTAVEVFDPMAITAEKVIKNNGCEEKVKVIHLRSTEIEKNFVHEKADIIVAEVFDTELIGEGALRSFKEGLKTLGKKECRVVPAKGRIWICPVSSEKLQQFWRLPNKHFKAPYSDCPGTAAVFDIQLSEIDPAWFEVLAEPFVAFDFNFEDADSIKYNEAFSHQIRVTSKKPETFDTVLMWWDIDMDGTGKNYISTVPTQFSNETAWRDHWMQAIYYLPKPIKVLPSEEIALHCSHDEYSLWFNIGEKPEGPSYCSCQLHSTLSRYDFYRLHKIDKNQAFIQWIQKFCKDKQVLTFGDGSLISLYASKSAAKVYAYEASDASARMIESYTSLNCISNVKVIQSFKQLDAKEKEIIVISEPFFSTAILPWHGFLRFSALIKELKNEIGNSLKIKVMPKKSKLLCLPVKFEHLWKIAAPVGIVDGFDLSDFDVLCQKARTIADPIVEQHSLFEYPSISTGTQQEAFTLFTESKAEAKTTIIVPENSGTNALVFWTETEFGADESDSVTISNGILSTCVVGEKPEWHPGHRQGVYFLPFEKIGNAKTIEIFIEEQENDLDFKFKVL
uniref:Protein arginine N-methyltransferase n=1 Tax=Panagrolaimus sp. ES5 TaxID=591445 RepID=A0AC34FSQ3_9BILA